MAKSASNEWQLEREREEERGRETERGRAEQANLAGSRFEVLFLEPQLNGPHRFFELKCLFVVLITQIKRAAAREGRGTTTSIPLSLYVFVSL